jgi:hypothetical protein
VQIVTGGFNFNWMNFVSAGARISSEDTTIKNTSEKIYKGFPNPVEHTLYVDGVEDGAPVQIIDMSGKPVLRGEIQNSAISMASLTTGFYIVNITSRKEFIRLKVSKR